MSAPSASRYSRQELFAPIGASGQERLGAARVLVVGCGALGTHAAESLARAGVGALRLVDRDVVEWSNLQRQSSFTEDDARDGLPKAEALAAHLRRVNSEVDIEAQAVELHRHNALLLAQDADLILDGSDNVATRFLLNDLSYKLGLPWVYAGAVEGRAVAQAFSGTGGPCLRCILGAPPPPGTLATCDTAGILGPAASVAAGWQAALALRILVEGSARSVARLQVRQELWDIESRVLAVEADPNCPTCVEGAFEFLDADRGDDAVRLCGRNAVQVRPRSPAGGADLDALARRIARLAGVERRSGCLHFSVEDVSVTVFSDLRAVFDGLTDLERARSLYARFLGE
jgi:adenylyltransferase/sulfurtransferase